MPSSITNDERVMKTLEEMRSLALEIEPPFSTEYKDPVEIVRENLDILDGLIKKVKEQQKPP